MESENRFRATCPSLPGCVVVAASVEEALFKIGQIAQSYMASFDAQTPLTLTEATAIVA